MPPPEAVTYRPIGEVKSDHLQRLAVLASHKPLICRTGRRPYRRRLRLRLPGWWATPRMMQPAYRPLRLSRGVGIDYRLFCLLAQMDHMMDSTEYRRQAQIYEGRAAAAADKIESAILKNIATDFRRLAKYKAGQERDGSAQ